MKAISIKGHWAKLIRDGLKTIETRTWKTDYRGKLLLCCSKKPASSLSGMAFAVCDLVDIRPMTRQDEHEAQCKKYKGAYSWILKNVKPIALFPVKGKLSIFEVSYDSKIAKER